MAARGLNNRRTGALGHLALERWRNHPVIGRDEIPAWLAPPCGLADRAARGLEAPRDLRVGHELSQVGVHVALRMPDGTWPVEQEKAVLRRQNRRPGVGSQVGDERLRLHRGLMPDAGESVPHAVMHFPRMAFVL
jgi:hypothetical protein